MPQMYPVAPRMASYFDNTDTHLGSDEEGAPENQQRVFRKAKRTVKPGPPAPAESMPPGEHEHHHPPPNEHHAAGIPHTGAHSLSQRALRKEIKEINDRLVKLYEGSQKLLKDRELGWPGTDSYLEMLKIMHRAHAKKKEANGEWMTEHHEAYEDMKKYINEKKKNPRSTLQNPHAGIHGRHVLHLHSQEIEVDTDELKRIHAKVAAMVDEYGLPQPEIPVMTNELPTHVQGSPGKYYIFPIIRYIRREKFRYVAMIDNWIRTLHAQGDATSEDQGKYVHIFNAIRSEKMKLSEARQQLAQIYKRKGHKRRSPIPALPDSGNPPRQVPRDMVGG